MSDKETIAQLTAEIAALKEHNTWLQQNNDCLKRALFGQKSEKTQAVFSDGSQQLGLFDEAEANQSVAEQKDEEELFVTGHSRKKKRTREEIFKDLPVVEEIIPVEETACPECGAETEVIGKEKIRDEIVYEPAKMYMKTIFAEVRKCPVCGNDESMDAVENTATRNVLIKAKASAPVLPKSFCSPELLSLIIYEKYFKAVPLERLSKQFTEQKCPLSTQTLSNWVIAAAKTYFKPIYDRLYTMLLAEPLIHADETVVQVLHEEGRKAKTQSRMWVYCTGEKAEHQIRLYEYCPTRAKTNAENFLNGFSGFLVCDGYAGYNNLPGTVRCGCWAHLRRRFRDAVPDDPILAEKSRAKTGFDYCNRLYALEREYKEKNLTPDEINLARRTQSAAVADEFFAWAQSLEVIGKTKLSEAIGYAISQKKALLQFVENPAVPLDNNAAERTVKPFVIGRKNWLFSTSPKGADASAMIYSVINTAFENGINIQSYLTQLFKIKSTDLPF